MNFLNIVLLYQFSPLALFLLSYHVFAMVVSVSCLILDNCCLHAMSRACKLLFALLSPLQLINILVSTTVTFKLISPLLFNMC